MGFMGMMVKKLAINPRRSNRSITPIIIRIASTIGIRLIDFKIEVD
jgi:hypothetical protein